MISGQQGMKSAAMIWLFILYYASDEGKLRIPSEHQWLTGELAAALKEEKTGLKFFYSWRHDEIGKVCDHEFNEWPEKLNEIFKEVIKEAEIGVINCDVEDVFRILLCQFGTYVFCLGERGDKYYTSELQSFRLNNMTASMMRSTFRLNWEDYQKAERYFLDKKCDPDRFKEMINWCKKIGLIMRPYIERDVNYIVKNYSW